MRKSKMPNPLNNKHDTQWDVCDRCGFLFPMGDLVKQKGLMVCKRRCWDDLLIERRYIEIERVLGQAVDQEGVDLRVVDRGFFEGVDESNM